MKKITDFFKKTPPACATQKVTKNLRTPAFASTRLGRKFAILLIILLGVYWGFLKIHHPDTFPIRKVKIVDTKQEVDHQTLCHTISPFLLSGMVWLDCGNLKQSLLQIPWIADVSIQRAWPDELVINISEQQPVAHFNHTLLLNNRGGIFSPGNMPVPGNLPWLTAPTHESEIVFTGYNIMNNRLKPLQLHIIAIDVSPRGSWQILLSNGMLLILGHEDILPRLQRFIASYPAVFANHTSEIVYIDLRYNNGFAVKWKNNLLPNSATP